MGGCPNCALVRKISGIPASTAVAELQCSNHEDVVQGRNLGGCPDAFLVPSILALLIAICHYRQYNHSAMQPAARPIDKLLFSGVASSAGDPQVERQLPLSMDNLSLGTGEAAPAGTAIQRW